MMTESVATGRERVLVCSDRPRVCEELSRELERCSAKAVVARCRDDWPAQPPALAIVDLARQGPPVRETCLELGDDVELWALADQSTADRIVPALAAGCTEYLFFPVNTDELRLRLSKHLEARGDEPSFGRAAEGALDLTFPSDVHHLGPAVEEVVRVAERLGVSGSRATLNLRVAVGEALANAVLYGNREDPGKKVRVSAEFSSDRIQVTVTDQGEGFDPDAVGDPTRPDNRDRSSGRGLFLLKSLMDEVRFNDVGNRVTLVLRT
ncbi:MAG: ATP-binding protein [Gemmatimonadota bacterium]